MAIPITITLLAFASVLANCRIELQVHPTVKIIHAHESQGPPMVRTPKYNPTLAAMNYPPLDSPSPLVNINLTLWKEVSQLPSVGFIEHPKAICGSTKMNAAITFGPLWLSSRDFCPLQMSGAWGVQPTLSWREAGESYAGEPFNARNCLATTTLVYPWWKGEDYTGFMVDCYFPSIPGGDFFEGLSDRFIQIYQCAQENSEPYLLPVRCDVSSDGSERVLERLDLYTELARPVVDVPRAQLITIPATTGTVSFRERITSLASEMMKPSEKKKKSYNHPVTARLIDPFSLAVGSSALGLAIANRDYIDDVSRYSKENRDTINELNLKTVALSTDIENTLSFASDVERSLFAFTEDTSSKLTIVGDELQSLHSFDSKVLDYFRNVDGILSGLSKAQIQTRNYLSEVALQSQADFVDLSARLALAVKELLQLSILSTAGDDVLQTEIDALALGVATAGYGSKANLEPIGVDCQFLVGWLNATIQNSQATISTSNQFLLPIGVRIESICSLTNLIGSETTAAGQITKIYRLTLFDNMTSMVQTAVLLYLPPGFIDANSGLCVGTRDVILLSPASTSSGEEYQVIGVTPVVDLKTIDEIVDESANVSIAYGFVPLSKRVNASNFNYLSQAEDFSRKIPLPEADQFMYQDLILGFRCPCGPIPSGIGTVIIDIGNSGLYTLRSSRMWPTPRFLDSVPSGCSLIFYDYEGKTASALTPPNVNVELLETLIDTSHSNRSTNPALVADFGDSTDALELLLSEELAQLRTIREDLEALANNATKEALDSIREAFLYLRPAAVNLSNISVELLEEYLVSGGFSLDVAGVVSAISVGVSDLVNGSVSGISNIFGGALESASGGLGTALGSLGSGLSGILLIAAVGAGIFVVFWFLRKKYSIPVRAAQSVASIVRPRSRNPSPEGIYAAIPEAPIELEQPHHRRIAPAMYRARATSFNAPESLHVHRVGLLFRMEANDGTTGDVVLMPPACTSYEVAVRYISPALRSLSSLITLPVYQVDRNQVCVATLQQDGLRGIADDTHPYLQDDSWHPSMDWQRLVWLQNHLELLGLFTNGIRRFACSTIVHLEDRSLDYSNLSVRLALTSRLRSFDEKEFSTKGIQRGLDAGERCKLETHVGSSQRIAASRVIVSNYQLTGVRKELIAQPLIRAATSSSSLYMTSLPLRSGLIPGQALTLAGWTIDSLYPLMRPVTEEEELAAADNEYLDL